MLLSLMALGCEEMQMFSKESEIYVKCLERFYENAIYKDTDYVQMRCFVLFTSWNVGFLNEIVELMH